MAEYGTLRVKTGLAEMLKGGVIMDVVDAEQARIAEDAGACAVMALERVPADIRRDGGVARMSDPEKIKEIQEAVSIPVMAKCRIGHFAEAQILEALEVDYIDESEVLTPADLQHHVDKWAFTVPFVCGATNLGEALRRISEGAAMIRTKGEAGTGDIVNAVTHMRSVFGAIRALGAMREDELHAAAKEHRAPYELIRWVAENGRLPVVTFTAGGIATPADASLCMQLGADGVFVGSGIFKSGDPERRAKAIVEATTHFDDASVLADVSAGLGEPMVGISASSLARSVRIGVLALQGAFREHAAALRSLGADVVEVRLPEELDGLDGLVIPGGESTTMMRLAELYGLDDAIRSYTGAVFGTCAGMIVLDREHLDLADLVVDRNAFGRQVKSFEADVELTTDEIPLRGVFIRAPRIRELGDGVEVIGALDGEPVLVRDGRFLLASFHPELTEDLRVHALFMTMVEEASSVGA
jgi:pyridoxal 5'-phosphate synthase pdxS subunit